MTSVGVSQGFRKGCRVAVQIHAGIFISLCLEFAATSLYTDCSIRGRIGWQASEQMANGEKDGHLRRFDTRGMPNRSDLDVVLVRFWGDFTVISNTFSDHSDHTGGHS